MAADAKLFILCIFTLWSAAAVQPPSPDVYPSSQFPSLSFDTAFRNLWGPSHQRVDTSGLTIWLDRSSGSGFKSFRPFGSGYFGASIKLQSGYTAGVITTLYLSNNEDYPGNHDEIDIEFLGKTFGEAYTLQTNIYVRGSGDGRLIGREMRFHLWFDPSQEFHRYSILWTPSDITFFVDDVPIRNYPKKSASTFPQRPMWVYGSIWDASSWATDNGRYKVHYRYQPFAAHLKDFKASSCNGQGVCRADAVWGGGLTGQQRAAMQWVQARYLVYDYCRDNSKDHSLTPECGWR